MAYNDPVLQRAMFQKQGQAVAPSVGLGGGLGSMTTPDENAKALRSMFAPTVDLGMPAEMLQQPQQPVQSFQEGGLALPVTTTPPAYTQEDYDPTSPEAVRQYLEGGSPPVTRTIPGSPAARSQMMRQQAMAEAAMASPKSQFRRDVESILPSLPTEERVMRNAEEFRRISEARRKALEAQQRAVETYRENAPGSSVGDYFRSLTPEEIKARAEARTTALQQLQAEGARIGGEYTRERASIAAPRGGGVASLDAARMLENDRAQENRLTFEGLAAAKPRDEQSISTKLDDIRQERLSKEQARSAAERRENMLLALMQAGFAMAAGRSPNAISNIGAGGQAGIAAFAGMEKARREDEAMRRREALQLDIAKMQLDRDPEAVRTYAILGGYKPGDSRETYQAAVQRGFNVTQSKEGPKLAAAIINNPLSMQFYSQQDLKDLAEYAKRGIVGMGGGSSYSGFRDVTPR